MKNIHFIIPAVVSILALAQGCGSTQEVVVSGEAKAPATVTGPIAIEFFEIAAEGDTAAPVSLKKIELTKAGAFEETLEIEGDKVRVFALADDDKNGACTEGEVWAELEAAVKEDGTVDPVSLDLTAAPCPAAASPK